MCDTIYEIPRVILIENSFNIGLKLTSGTGWVAESGRLINVNLNGQLSNKRLMVQRDWI